MSLGMGCMKLEDEIFIGVMRCNNFIAGQADWQEKWKEQMKKCMTYIR